MPIVNLNNSRVVKVMFLKVGFLQGPGVSDSSVNKVRPRELFFMADTSAASGGSPLSRVTTAAKMQETL